jgi:hypothetical protein
MDTNISTTDNSKTNGANDSSRKSPSSWKLEGDYFEGCNCDIVCPCSFFQDPDEGSCYVACAWHIQKGAYDDNTPLDNLNVVAMFNSPGNMVSGPKWKAALYIDQRATRTERRDYKNIYWTSRGIFCGSR